jgi:hypothetical protein
MTCCEPDWVGNPCRGQEAPQRTLARLCRSEPAVSWERIAGTHRGADSAS